MGQVSSLASSRIPCVRVSPCSPCDAGFGSSSLRTELPVTLQHVLSFLPPGPQDWCELADETGPFLYNKRWVPRASLASCLLTRDLHLPFLPFLVLYYISSRVSMFIMFIIFFFFATPHKAYNPFLRET